MGMMINRRRACGGKKKPIFTASQNPYLINMMLDMRWISQPALYEEDLENIPNFLIVKTTSDNLEFSLARFPRRTGYLYRNEIYSNTITFEKAGNHLVIINGSNDASSYEFDGRGFRPDRIQFFWFLGVSDKYALRNCFYSIGVFLGYSQYGTDGGRDYTIDENLHEGWMPLSSLDESWQITSEIETW